MERRKFGNTDMEVSILGFGGAEIGYDRAPQADVDRLLNSALDAGLNVIDTAECYIDSEEKIGRAVSGRRDQFYLFTKCGHASGLPFPDWDPRMLAKSIDRSLSRLQTNQVDLIQLHSCSEEALREGKVVRVLQDARNAGKTRYIGYSGDGAAALYAVESGAFDALQTSVNIADQEAIDLTLFKARERNMGVIAKRPIANAAWRMEAISEEKFSATASDTSGYTKVYKDRLKLLDYDFLRRDIRESISTALRFTLATEGVHTAIVGTRKPERWQQNARLLEEGPLSLERYEMIRARWNAVAKADWVGQQ